MEIVVVNCPFLLMQSKDLNWFDLKEFLSKKMIAMEYKVILSLLSEFDVSYSEEK